MLQTVISDYKANMSEELEMRNCDGSENASSEENIEDRDGECTMHRVRIEEFNPRAI